MKAIAGKLFSVILAAVFALGMFGFVGGEGSAVAETAAPAAEDVTQTTDDVQTTQTETVTVSDGEVAAGGEENTAGGEENTAGGEESASADRSFTFNKQEMEGKAFLFFGDSLTARHGLSATDIDYTQLLREEYGFYSYNGAVSGATWTVDLNASRAEYIDNHIFTQLEKAQYLIRDADYISIMLGTNDYGWGLRPVGTADDAMPTCKEEAKTVYQAARYALKLITEANPDVKIMLMTPPLWLARNDFNTPNDENVTLGQVRDAVKAVGAEYGCKVVDMSEALPADAQYYNADRLHISPLGYQTMASYIKNYAAGA